MTPGLRVLLVVQFLLGAVAAVPPDPIDDALREMCERELADKAAEYCRAQAAVYIEQPPLRSRWTMRQMECTCQAVLNGRSGDAPAWEKIAAIESEYRGEFPEDPRLPWLAWQLGRADLLRAQQALAKWLAAPAAQDQRESALQAIRRGLARMDEVQADIKVRLPLGENRNGSTKAQAPSSELQGLAVDCTLLRCEALLVRAKCYAIDSPDRLAALADVDRVASEMLLRAPQDWPARDELLVAQAAAGLEVGKRVQSKRILAGILSERPVEAVASSAGTATGTAASTAASDATSSTALLPSPRARVRAGSLLIQALCVDREIAAAEQALSILAGNFSGPEVELAQVSIRLAKIESLSAEAREAELKSLIDLTQAIGQQYGGYWRSRAEALLVDSSQASSNSTNGNSAVLNDLVSVEVRQLLAGGQTAAAVAKLRTASDGARAVGRMDDSLALAYQAAALLQRQQEWLTVADILIPATLAAPESKSAAPAHALAGWCLAQALKQDSKNVALQQRYERALREQLTQWPAAQESSTSEEYLSNWLSANKRFEELAGMWLLRATTAREPESIAHALRQWLDTMLSKLPLVRAPAQQVLFVDAIARGDFGTATRSATITGLASAMLSTPMTQTEAELHINLKTPAHAAEESIADQALLSSVLALAAARRSDPVACRNSVQMLPLEQLPPVVRLAWTKSIVEAMNELPAAQIDAWTAVADAIEFPTSPVEQHGAGMKMVALRLRMLQADTLTTRLALLSEIEQLAKQNARDATMQLSYAAALAQSDEARFDEAVRILKRVAVGSGKDSDAHLRARWLEIRWRSARGESDAAAQIAAMTIKSHDRMESFWKTRFTSVAQR